MVHVSLTNYRGQRQKAALVGPLHPIRCLWLAGWAALGEKWVTEASNCRCEFVSPARDVLLNRLLPSNQPPYLSVGHGSVFTAVDNVHALWTLYASNLERDPRGLIGNVCSALGLPEPNIGGVAVTGRYLAGRVQRYLVQHPYVRTIAINVFNPGRAKVLADMLLELQSVDVLSELAYDIRLFVPDANEPGVGESLLELLSPEGSSTAQRADAFSALGRDHLNPKLRVAIRPTRDFRSESDAYPAHISMLFDVFPAEAVSAGKYKPEESGSPVFGLLQDFVLEYIDDGEIVAWTRQPRHGMAASIVGAEAISDLLSSLPTVFSAATATVATGRAAVSNRPQVTLALDHEDRALIHQVHEISDWVFTVDRNIGIEYFDHNDQGSRPDYLIEHSDSSRPLPDSLQTQYNVSPEGVEKLKEQGDVQSSGVDGFDFSGGPEYEVLLGSTSPSPQYGIIGEYSGRKIALDLNQTHTISLFGVQGQGKSYTLGSVVEMATMPISGINRLPSPLATVIFHYSPTQDYRDS